MDIYKRNIDTLKNKLEFKLNLEKAMNLENILKSEISKGKVFSKEIENITKINNLQIKSLNNIDKENRFTEKIEILKIEVKNLKENLKESLEKYVKQEKYIKSIHEKISQVENQIKKLSQPKIEIKKNFSKDELKTILESLNNLKIGINHKREILKDLNKTNEDKLISFISLNKRIEQDYKENEKVKLRLFLDMNFCLICFGLLLFNLFFIFLIFLFFQMNKMLIFKKNEMKRLVKNNNFESKIEKMDNRSLKKIIKNNGDLSRIFPTSNYNYIYFNFIILSN